MLEVVHVLVGRAQWHARPSCVVCVEVNYVGGCVNSGWAVGQAPPESVIYKLVELPRAIQHTPVDVIISIVGGRGWARLNTQPAYIQCEVVARATILAGHCQRVSVEARHRRATRHTSF